MDQVTMNNVHWSFWFVGGVALLWNAAGVVITMVYTLAVGIAFSIGEWIGIILLPIVLAFYLVWYVKYAARKGWLRRG